MNISAHRINVLLAVQRAGGVVAAADQLHLTPSAVSQQIKLLEKEVGVRVLDRTPAGATLTQAGRVLAEAAERIEAELATARRELAAVDSQAPAGTVRIGSFSTAIRALLLPLLADLEAAYPGVELVIEEVEERAALTRLRHGELDLALLERDEHTLPPAPRAMADVPLLDESWLVVVPPGSPAPTNLVDLAGATWINLDPDTAGASALNRLAQQIGGPLESRHVAYDYDVVLAMVSEGLGHALLPELAVHSGFVPDGVVVARLPGLGSRQLVARHRATRSEPSQAVKTVMEALLARVESLELGR
ncbi:Morphology and auto-aggregation control protein [Actinomyces bovis]|uniref:Morphology and auto-aggregation control protein n=1 Tax=Actinomyces bovis TaxID=1658 RepID=A0ABY1VKV1_9ACTO|nr:LysR family transcriptional regulator [Actinomyces bovis]SPT52725.1 Morphology and auto-aggregation control protein [Actinomyces bovis]VEG54694.1 Morphology and auto-aggregation control protein [Actinomyces israelii]